MIDITKFCDPSSLIGLFKKPFAYEDKVVASYGHILVCISTSNSDYEKMSTQNHNRFAKIIEPIKSNLIWKPINIKEIEIPVKKDCGFCERNGKTTKTECEECNGLGYVDVETAYNTYRDLNCASCRGDGFVSDPSNVHDCLACNGNGVAYVRHESVVVAGVRLNPSYWELVMNEVGLEVASAMNGDMLMFKTQDAIGSIMGLRL